MLKLLILAAMGVGTVMWDGMPPSRFQGGGIAQVWFVSPGTVDVICNEKALGFNVIACSYRGQRRIIVPNPCPLAEIEYYARVMCHELGHINGWPGNHTP